LRHIERRAVGSWPEFVTLSGALAEEPGVASAIRTVCGTETRLINIENSVDWSKVKRPNGPLAAWTSLVAIALPQTTVAAVNKKRRVA
jgi:hypothetical protein